MTATAPSGLHDFADASPGLPFGLVKISGTYPNFSISSTTPHFKSFKLDGKCGIRRLTYTRRVICIGTSAIEDRTNI